MRISQKPVFLSIFRVIKQEFKLFRGRKHSTFSLWRPLKVAKITQSQLKKIIVEEVHNEFLDENLLDTFKALGGDLKKWYKDANMRGDVAGSKRDSTGAMKIDQERKEATYKAIDGNLRSLKNKFGPDGERGNKEVQDQIADLKGQLKALGRGGASADQVLDGLADAAGKATAGGQETSARQQAIERGLSSFEKDTGISRHGSGGEGGSKSVGVAYVADEEANAEEAPDDEAADEEAADEEADGDDIGIKNRDLMKALSQLRNVGNFNPKEFLRKFDDYKKRSLGGLGAYAKAAATSGAPNDAEKEVLAKVAVAFQSKGLEPLERAYDNAVKVLHNLYARVGAEAQLQESFDYSQLTEDGRKVLLICLSSYLNNKTQLQTINESYTRRSHLIGDKLMKKWNLNS